MIRTLAALSILAALSGCGLRVYQPDGFGKAKRFALVSLSAPSRVSLLTESKSVSGAVGGAAHGFTHDARPILAQTRPAIVKGLASTGHYRLLPEREVLGSGPYAAAAADPTRMLTAEWVTPTGYKYFDDVEDAQQLARKLGVDGALIVGASYGWVFNGVNAFGLVSAGAVKGKVILTVAAIDKQGRVVWKDWVGAVSDRSRPKVGESIAWADLEPMLVEATEKALRELQQRLDERL